MAFSNPLFLFLAVDQMKMCVKNQFNVMQKQAEKFDQHARPLPPVAGQSSNQFIFGLVILSHGDLDASQQDIVLGRNGHAITKQELLAPLTLAASKTDLTNFKKFIIFNCCRGNKKLCLHEGQPLMFEKFETFLQDKKMLPISETPILVEKNLNCKLKNFEILSKSNSNKTISVKIQAKIEQLEKSEKIEKFQPKNILRSPLTRGPSNFSPKNLFSFSEMLRKKNPKILFAPEIKNFRPTCVRSDDSLACWDENLKICSDFRNSKVSDHHADLARPIFKPDRSQDTQKTLKNYNPFLDKSLFDPNLKKLEKMKNLSIETKKLDISKSKNLNLIQNLVKFSHFKIDTSAASFLQAKNCCQNIDKKSDLMIKNCLIIHSTSKDFCSWRRVQGRNAGTVFKVVCLGKSQFSIFFKPKFDRFFDSKKS